MGEIIHDYTQKHYQQPEAKSFHNYEEFLLESEKDRKETEAAINKLIADFESRYGGALKTYTGVSLDGKGIVLRTQKTSVSIQIRK